VLFLAGHTGVIGGEFCLLLSDHPISDRGNRLLAARGDGPPNESLSHDDPDVLPYAELYRKLSHLECLRRLVIIDACHSEAVLQDTAVHRIHEFVERGAHEARTSYILAARPDDPASEVEPLGHGLLTYVLLRGLGDSHLKEVPDPSIFTGLRTADRDRDHQITTEEIREYVAVVLPRLTAQFPELVSRDRDGRRPESTGPQPTIALDPRLRSNTSSFPIVELGPDEPGTGGVGPRAGLGVPAEAR
jgi:hypothetical protein